MPTREPGRLDQKPIVWYKRPFTFYASFAMALVIGGIALIVVQAQERMRKTETVTVMECYLVTNGRVTVDYEGLGRGLVHAPKHGSPWVFEDRLTGEQIIRRWCVSGEVKYLLRKRPGEDRT